jgi:hypothetical protein
LRRRARRLRWTFPNEPKGAAKDHVVCLQPAANQLRTISWTPAESRRSDVRADTKIGCDFSAAVWEGYRYSGQVNN